MPLPTIFERLGKQPQQLNLVLSSYHLSLFSIAVRMAFLNIPAVESNSIVPIDRECGLVLSQVEIQ